MVLRITLLLLWDIIFLLAELNIGKYETITTTTFMLTTHHIYVIIRLLHQSSSF